MHQIQNSGNPQMAFQNLISQNPNVQNILNLTQSHNVSLETIAKIMAQQKGYDINALIRELQN